MRFLSTSSTQSGKRSLLLALLCAALLLAGCARKSPKETIQEALTATFSTRYTVSETLGLPEIFSSLTEDPSHRTELDLTLQRLELPSASLDLEKLEGLGVSLSSCVLPENRELSAKLGLHYGTVVSLEGFADLKDTSLSVCVPRLLNSSFSADLSTLGSDLKGAGTAAQLLSGYVSLPEDFSVDPWATLSPVTTLFEDFFAQRDDNARAEYKALTASFVESFTYQRLRRSAAGLPKDTQAKHFYRVTIPSEALHDYLHGLVLLGYEDVLPLITGLFEDPSMSWFTSHLPELTLPDRDTVLSLLSLFPDACDDMVLIVGLDKKGLICSAKLNLNVLEHPFEVNAQLKGSDFGLHRLSLTFTDEFQHSAVLDYTRTLENALSETELSLRYTAPELSLNGLLQSEYDLETNEFSFLSTLSENGNVRLGVSAEGLLKDILPGNRFTIVYHYLDVDLPEYGSVSVSGTFGLSTTPEPISLPTAKRYRLFGLTRLDLLFLGTQLTSNIQNDPVFSKLLELFQ